MNSLFMTFWIHSVTSIYHCSVAQSCLTLCDPMDCSTPGLPVHHQLLELVQTHVHWVSDAIQPSHPPLSLLLLPSVFPSISVFSNELALHIRWPKYWSFSFFSISSSNEHSGWIFRWPQYINDKNLLVSKKAWVSHTLAFVTLSPLAKQMSDSNRFISNHIWSVFFCCVIVIVFSPHKTPLREIALLPGK